MTQYAAYSGINVQPRHAPRDKRGPAGQLVDSSALKEVTEQHKRLATKQYWALSEYLRENDGPGTTSDSDARLLRELQHQLDTWNAEFSDEFLSGTSPIFDANKARRYTSWWNYAREDVMQLFHGDAAANPQPAHKQGR